MVLILIFVIALVAWALHLMQEAIDSKEFSLMLAGFLVASSAAAMMAVYFLMGDYMGYVAQMSHRAYLVNQYSDPSLSIVQPDISSTELPFFAVKDRKAADEVFQLVSSWQ